MATRRQLRFTSLDDVARDAEALLASGYTKTGNWDLSQVCNHLSDWLSFPVEGFPKTPLALRPVFWLLRTTIGRRKYETYVREQTFPVGAPTMPQTVHKPGGDDRAAVARLKDKAEQYKTHTGMIHPSPLFGPLTKDEALKVQLVHCAHHLSFLVPR